MLCYEPWPDRYQPRGRCDHLAYVRARLYETTSGKAGAGALAGMGLTVSLFIANISLNSEESLAQVKVGLISAAVISAVLGLLILRKYSKNN